MGPLPPGPWEAVGVLLTQFGLPVGFATALTVLGWAKDWIDAGRGAVSTFRGVTGSARSASRNFLRLLFLQTTFLVVTVGSTCLVFNAATLAPSTLGRDWGKTAVVLVSSLFRPFGAPVWVSIAAASAFIGVANISARLWSGTGPLGCAVSSAISVVAVIIAGVVVARITSAAHRGQEVGVSWGVWVSSVAVVALWNRLVVLVADAPLDLRHAVAVARSIRQ